MPCSFGETSALSALSVQDSGTAPGASDLDGRRCRFQLTRGWRPQGERPISAYSSGRLRQRGAGALGGQAVGKRGRATSKQVAAMAEGAAKAEQLLQDTLAQGEGDAALLTRVSASRDGSETERGGRLVERTVVPEFSCVLRICSPRQAGQRQPQRLAGLLGHAGGRRVQNTGAQRDVGVLPRPQRQRGAPRPQR